VVNFIFNELLREWGTPKMVQVAIIAIVGAGIFGVIAINTIRNKPKNTVDYGIIET
jgi:hypothetical protein